MGPNGEKKYLASIIAGNENYEVTEGEISLDEKIFRTKRRKRHKGVFSSFQYPVEAAHENAQRHRQLSWSR
jgi:Fe-S cluster assembly ATP-binding protein